MSTQFTAIPLDPNTLQKMRDFKPAAGAPSYSDLLMALHAAVGDEKDHDIPEMLGWAADHSIPQHVIAVKHAIADVGRYL